MTEDERLKLYQEWLGELLTARIKKLYEDHRPRPEITLTLEAHKKPKCN